MIIQTNNVLFYIFYCYDCEGLFFLVGYIINRHDGENVALITESDFRSLVETIHLLKTPAECNSFVRSN